MTGKSSYPISSLGTSYGLEVTGTYYHQGACAHMFWALGGKDNQDIFTEVALVPEPDNPHGRNREAISVRWGNRVLGYIPAEEAGKYGQLRRVAASGFDATVKARIWTNTSWEGERRYYIYLLAPAPELMIPLNPPPNDGFALLPYGSKVQVTKESEHIDHLADYVPPNGEGQLLVSLHCFEAGKTKKWTGIEVRLDGEPIGELTKVSSEKFAPAVKHFESRGLDLYTRAIIKGSSLAAEVTLCGAKANELEESFLSTDETKPLPRLVDYEPNPDDYPLIKRYQPDDVDRLKTKTKPTPDTHIQQSQWLPDNNVVLNDASAPVEKKSQAGNIGCGVFAIAMLFILII